MKMRPIVISALFTRVGRRRLLRIAAEPVLDDVMIELLGPEQAGVGLTGNTGFRTLQRTAKASRIKLVGFSNPIREDPVGIGAKRLTQRFLFRKKSKLHGHLIASTQLQTVV